MGSSSCALLRRMASKARGTKRRGKEGSTRSSSAVVPNLVGAGSRSLRLTLTLILILILTPTLTLTPTPTLTLTLSPRRAPEGDIEREVHARELPVAPQVVESVVGDAALHEGGVVVRHHDGLEPTAFLDLVALDKEEENVLAALAHRRVLVRVRDRVRVRVRVRVRDRVRVRVRVLTACSPPQSNRRMAAASSASCHTSSSSSMPLSGCVWSACAPTRSGLRSGSGRPLPG